jgi:hypothetical protein
VTPNLGIVPLIPDDAEVPTLELTGGKVRRKRGKPATLLADEETLKRIRNWDFAVSVVGATCIAPPHLLTKSGKERNIKEAFIAASADVIVPLPSVKWSRSSGQKFLSLCKPPRNPAGQAGTLYLITVVPHQDSKEPATTRARVGAIRDRFLAGMGEIAKYHNLLIARFYKAVFIPNHEFPALEPVKDDEQDLTQLEKLYERVNPDHRTDIRLVVSLELLRKRRTRAPSRDTTLKRSGDGSSSRIECE